MTAILIGGSIPHQPLVRVLAIPMPLFFIQIGLQGIVMGWMAEKKIPTPTRISSVAPGEPTPPFVLPLIEDVVAVDGDGKKDYRMRLMERWRVSRQFRVMIKGLNWFWGIGSLFFGAGLMAVVWTTPEQIAYGVGKLIYIYTYTHASRVRFGSKNIRLTHWLCNNRMGRAAGFHRHLDVLHGHLDAAEPPHREGGVDGPAGRSRREAMLARYGGGGGGGGGGDVCSRRAGR